MALFENYEGRMPQLQPVLEKYGFKSFEEVKAFTNGKGVDAYSIVESTQPICFENVKWAYELGAAIAMKENARNAADAARWIGTALQAFCIPGSVADQRQVGIGHGNLGARLLDEETECFAFLAGHESFAAAEGAIKIALNANKVRTKPLRVILNGLGKDAAMIISRINGFTYVQTKYDYLSADVKEDHALTVVSKTAYSIVESTQPICFENVKWAYELGAAIAMKENAKNAAEAARWIGTALQAFCIPGSVADQRQVGIGHGNLGAMLLDEQTECFAFLAGHESFAAA